MGDISNFEKVNNNKSCMSKLNAQSIDRIFANVVNTVPYRPEYTVPAGNPVRLTSMFRTGRNTGRTGQYRLYRPVFEYRTET